MNSFIEMINQWGGRFVDFAWPMLWQSSLLIVVLLAMDFLLRRRIQASIRYALWLAVLVKLCLPPTLALPTSPAWWLHSTSPAAKPQLHYTVTYDSQPMPEISQRPIPVYVPPEPAMTGTAWCLAASGIVSILLWAGLLLRWWHISRRVRHAMPSERLTAILNQARHFSGKKPGVPVKVTGHSLSPAVCGLLRPTILIPRSLAEGFSDDQLRVVLLHELLHLRRRDVWINFLQSLLQIVYWWHPLLWLANARIRRVREEAVDDAVMLALRDKAETYAPTLLEVAKLALNRPLASLGLVGILESRSALRQRIERLVNFRAPRKAGLTFASLLGICVFSAVALPMGEAPASASDGFSTAAVSAEKTLTMKVDPEVFIRNIKAQADWRLDAPTDNWTKILLDIMRSATVDCSPPHGIAFNAKTGEVTTRNTPQQLKIIRQVIEQLNRSDGLFEMPHIQRRKVLIEGRYFWMSPGDREKLVADLPSERGKNNSTRCWIISPEQFTEVDQRIASLNLHPFHKPRIETGDGLGAKFWVGNKPNGVEFDCLPYVAEKGLNNGHKGIALVFRTKTIGSPTGAKQELAGTNQYNASGEIGVEDGGGFIVSAKTRDGSPTNVVIVIGVEIVTNTSSAPIQQRSQTIISQPNGTNEEEATNLLVRTFKVDTQTFIANLNRMDASVGENITSPVAIQTAIRKFFASLGVNWDLPVGKNIFFNDMNGMLLVRATQSDLDTIETIVQALNQVIPQIHIKARFMEVPKGTLDGFSKFIAITNQSRQIVGILPGQHAAAVVRTLQSRSDIKELAEPEVTTTSGRQTEMRATVLQTIITNFVFRQGEMGRDSVIPQSTRLETGPMLDTVATVLPDNRTIDLRLAASRTEFAGYDKAPTNLVEHINNSGEPVPVVLPVVLPVLQVSKADAHLKIWDGQTVVLRGVTATHSTIARQMKSVTVPDGAQTVESPVYGEQVTRVATQKELLVLITVTLVDPAGNRIHSAEDMPFAKDAIPPQDTP